MRHTSSTESALSSLRPLVLALLLWSLAAPAAAQPQLTLSRAVDLALGRNPDVLRARERISEFRLRVRGVRADVLPTIDLVGALQQTRDPGLRNSQFFSRILSSGDPLPPGALDPFRFGTFFYQVEFEQPVWQFGRVGHALQAAREETAGIELDVRQVEQRIALDVARAYLDLLLARERRGVLEAERTARERQVQQVRDRLELGDATRLEMLQAEVALANLRPEILSADNVVNIAEARLNEALGRDVSTPMEPMPPLEVERGLTDLPPTDALLQLALDQRPEVRRYDRTRRVLLEAEGATRADLLPDITARASLGINTFQLQNLSKPSLHNWTMGVNVRWTLFDGQRTASTIGQYRSQRRQSELDEQAFRGRLARDIEQARGTWQQAMESLDVTSLTVEQAREARRVAEDSFEWGAVTFVEVTEAERQLRQAEFNRLQAYHGALVALADIKMLVGLRPDVQDAQLIAAASAAAGPTAQAGTSHRVQADLRH
jgi:outer membrane protein TolC